MFKLPDGREVAITSAAALALVFTVNQSATKSWLQGVIEMMTHTDEATRKDILRGANKDKGEEYPPLVQAFVKEGYSPKTAAARRSEIKAIEYGWYHGEADRIAQASGWMKALDIARQRKDMDTEVSKRVKTRNAVVILGAELEQQLKLDPTAARALAQEKFVQTQEEQKAQATLERAETMANKMGFRLIPLQYTPAILAELAVNAGMIDETLEALEQAKKVAAIDAEQKQKEIDEAAKGMKAAVTNERQQHKAIAIPSLADKETETQ